VRRLGPLVPSLFPRPGGVLHAPPGQVTGLTATAASTTEIDLAWTAASGATSYEVERSLDGSTQWAQIAAQAGVSVTDTGRAVATRYYYRVRAVKDGVAGPWSATADTYSLPAQVANLAAAAASTTQIDLTWDAAASATSYLVERSANGTTGWTSVGTPSSAAYSDTGRTAGTRYYYRVSAVNPGGTGAASSVANSYTLPAQVGTVTPTVASSSEIDLDWADVTSATAYSVERSLTGSGGWAEVGTPATSALADTGLTAATAYYYRVRALNPGGYGAYSATATATTDP